MAAKIAENGPLAVKRSKQVIKESIDWSQDETFDKYRATVAGFGNMLLITPLVPEGKLIVIFLKSYQLSGIREYSQNNYFLM